MTDRWVVVAVVSSALLIFFCLYVSVQGPPQDAAAGENPLPDVMQKETVDESAPLKALQPPKTVLINACTIIRNQANRVLEWIAFHRLQGVDRFMIFDDGSTDDVKTKLKPFVLTGVVEFFDLMFPTKTLSDVPYVQKLFETCDETLPPDRLVTCQKAAFAHCFETSVQNKDSWIVPMDVDEFVFRPIIDGKSQGAIWSFLNQQDESTAQVTVRGTVFGPEFQFANWTGLVTQTHVHRPTYNADGDVVYRCSHSACNNQMPGAAYSQKSFARANKWQIDAIRVHDVIVAHGGTAIVNSRTSATPIRIHHYQHLSVEQSSAKYTRLGNTLYHDIVDEELQSQLSTTVDTSLQFFKNQLELCIDRTTENMFDPACFVPVV